MFTLYAEPTEIAGGKVAVGLGSDGDVPSEVAVYIGGRFVVLTRTEAEELRDSITVALSA